MMCSLKSTRSGTREPWWRYQGWVLLFTALFVAAVVATLGWVTGLRPVMHAALLSAASVALLPVLFIAGGLALALTVGLILAVPAAVFGGGGGELGGEAAGVVGEVTVGVGKRFFRVYYRFLGRSRHPAFWGALVGVLLGGLLLWGLVALLIVPDETRTVRLLAEAKDRIERIYATTSKFPAPDSDGRLAVSSLGLTGDAVLRDGFGRPLSYAVRGRWKLASWTLSSLGFDGQPGGGDDLCISGYAKLGRWAGTALDILRVLENVREGGASLGERLQGVSALRCAGG